MDSDSVMVSTMKPAEEGSSQYYVNLLNVYLPRLSKTLDVAQIIPYLIQQGILEVEDNHHLLDLARSNRQSAVLRLMKKLMRCPDPDWFFKFKLALKDSGQERIYELLGDQDHGAFSEESFERLLAKYYVKMIETIEPIQLLPVLFERKTITKTDEEEIISEEKNYGRTRAAQKLLATIPFRKNGWFINLIYALKSCGYTRLVEEISPHLLTAESEQSLWRESEALIKANLEVNKSKPEKAGKGNAAEQKVSVVTQEVSHKATTSQAKPVTSLEASGKPKQLHDEIQTTVLPSREDKTSEKKPGDAETPTEMQSEDDYSINIVDLREEGCLPLSSLCSHSESSDYKMISPLSTSHSSSLNKKQGLESKSNTSIESMRLSKKQKGNSNSVVSEDGGSLIVKCDSAVLMSDLNLRSSTSESGLNLNLRTESLVKSTSSKLRSLPSDTDLFESTSTIVPEEEIITKKQLELRGYQKELAEEGIKGKNCVIVAPTGSGKTLVALYISKHHLETCPEEDRKIVFFVPKVALVAQQRNQYKRYMNDDCKVDSLSGERNMEIPLMDFIKANDVIVMTPQIWLNAIAEGQIDDSFSQVTLMIFDECHNAMKDHPYNIIMASYIDILLSGDQQKNIHLPQVIGLTASPGVGKSKNDDAAIDHVLQLCANLAAQEICTVKSTQSMEELQKYVNIPIEDIIEVQGRTHDRFFILVSQIMDEIEKKMTRGQDINQLMKEVPSIQRVLSPPADRGSEAYTQFLANLKREVAKFFNQDIRRFFVTCQQHLEIYNNSLLINADCRTVDALKYIKDQLLKVNSGFHSLPNDDTDNWLNRIYTGKAVDLGDASQSRDAINPKLKCLEQLILRFYQINEKAQGIIFCKTRFMTEALMSWIKETPSLTFLNPHNLVGSGSTSSKGNVSMTHRKLDDVLKYFKDGVHKVIVATSVVEEGLDVKSCNYVIRYEHVSSDISRIQSRGRARAEDAQFVLVAETGKGAQRREVANQVREELMTLAIYRIHRLTNDEINSKIRRFQEQAQQEREMNKAMLAHNSNWKASHEGDYQLRCFKCNAFGIWNTDLRTIKQSHHVVLDKEFGKRINIFPHPRPKKYHDFEKKGKISCNICGLDWGITAIYKNVPVLMLKVCSFSIVDPEQRSSMVKKWKDVEFPVEELEQDDMKNVGDVFTNIQE